MSLSSASHAKWTRRSVRGVVCGTDLQMLIHEVTFAVEGEGAARSTCFREDSLFARSVVRPEYLAGLDVAALLYAHPIFCGEQPQQIEGLLA